MAALILIDIQNDYFPGGAFELVGVEAAKENAKKVLEHFRSKQLPLVHIQHLFGADGPFFVPGTPGAEIHADVAPKEGEKLFQKNFPSAFLKTGLAEYLEEQKIKDIVLVGNMTQMCIDTTARVAQNYGFNVTVVHDACATRDFEFNGVKVPAQQVHASHLAAMAMFFAKIVSTEEFLKQ